MPSERCHCSCKVLPWMRILLVAVCVIVAISTISSCNILVPAGYMVDGTGKNPAEHELDQVKTLVFVDDRRNVLPRSVLRANLAQMISDELVTKQLVPSVVNSTDAMAMVRSKERNNKIMGIDAIARECGVQQVIFVEMENFYTNRGYADIRPTATCLVKVMHFGKGARVYPKVDLGDTGERRITAQLREVSPEDLNTASNRRQVELAVIADLSTDVVKLFYEHEARDLGENLGIR